MKLLSGLRAWTLQRVSALLLLGFALWFAGDLLVAPPGGYEEWRAMVARPAASAAFAVFFAALLLHAWVGVRDIVLDYVHSLPMRAVVLVGVAVVLSATSAELVLALAALHAR